MIILLIFAKKIPLKKDRIGKIEYFEGVKHCNILAFLLSDNNKYYPKKITTLGKNKVKQHSNKGSFI